MTEQRHNSILDYLMDVESPDDYLNEADLLAEYQLELDYESHMARQRIEQMDIITRMRCGYDW